MNGNPPPTKQDNRPDGRQRPPARFPWAWLLILLLVLFGWQFAARQMESKEEEQPYSTFLDMLESNSNDISKVEIATNGNGTTLVVELKQGTATGGAKTFRVVAPVTEDLLERLDARRKDGLQVEFTQSNSVLWGILGQAASLLLFFALLYFLFYRRMGGGANGAFSFGKSRARLMNHDSRQVTFKDVAGVDEAREEVQEIVEFLKDPKKFQRLGGRIPKGVLLVGPPGTGKTLLARAIAGEAGVPFFSISGSDFVEMFVGVGASRVRDMFEQGKKSAPCIIFIDEIDAVGRSRFSGIGGGHDEREQTLNALLVEMDGFDAQEGIIIIAATNRPDVLDPALLRPGRFDRQIVVDLPTLEGREAILKIHARKVKLADEVSLHKAAQGTPGFSGADLANLVNEAALLAARRNADAISQRDLEEARDKVCWGRERRSRVLDDKEKRHTAVHEVGHAIVIALSPEVEPLHKVTIIPRGRALGATFQLPEKDRYTVTRTSLVGDLAGAMGGRAAEELVFGEISTGASQDIRQATNTARRMVTEWGMSDRLGPQFFGDREELLFLGREVNRSNNISPETARVIDEEVKRLIDDAHATASQLLRSHRAQLDQIVELLLEKETLDGRDVLDILHHGRVLSAAERDAEDAAAKPSPDPLDPKGEGEKALEAPQTPDETADANQEPVP